MISITIHPQSAAHIDVMAQAMKTLLASVTPPAVAPTQAEVAKAVEHAVETKKEAKPPKPSPVQKAEAPAATQPAPSASDTPQPEPGATAETATESPSNKIEYTQVGKAITEMVKTNRDHAVATLAKFGAKKGTELKEEDYAAFLKELG